MSLASARHPERLPWFVSGRLDRAELAVIERHLETCDACRAQVEALRSMYRSILEEAPSAHVSPERLVGHHTGDPRVSDDDRRSVEEHLRKCHTCSADLAALERADASLRRRHGRRVLGSAASILIVVAMGWQLAGRRAEPPSVAAVTRVVLPTAQRGTTAKPLIGAGPWELEVWLPALRARAPAYRVRICRGDDPSNAVFETSVAAGPKDESILLFVPSGVLRPGHHVLSLIPRGGGGSEDDVRGFDVESTR
jgi:anti-sigma factor RsiW